jgi:uncharacterized protein YfdQ (DUF2303 family)
MTIPEAIGPTTASAVERLTIAANAIRTVEGTTFALVQHGQTITDISDKIERTQDTPNRKTGTASLHNVESLLTYAADQAQDRQGYLYADVEARTLTIVFNDNKESGVAGWRDHRAQFKAELTPEAERWIKNSGTDKQMSQTVFAEFIEDNFADLAGDHAQTLLEVATTIQAKTGINFSSAKRLDNGQTQMVYNETIDATAGASGTTTIPQTFMLGLRLFKGDKTGYAIKARLKYRLNSGALKFWYELDRVERALEDAFAGYVEKASESQYTVLHGKAGA